MDNLAKLIADHEDWLVDRVVHYAHEHGFTRYTSTLREAWRSSICGLSQPLIRVLVGLQGTKAQRGEVMQAAVAFGVQEAVEHRARGIDMAQFLGLLKLYRQAYFDLVDEQVADPDRRRWLTKLLLEMFDSIELGLAHEWVNSSETAKLAALNDKNRQLSNEKNKYLTVFESIAEPAILLDTDNRPLHVNAAGGRLLLGEATPGASYYGEGADPRLRASVEEILAKADAEVDAAGRITLQTAAGPRSFNIAVQDMLDISRKFAGRVIILNDVTDLLAAIEAAEVADRAKSAFLATVSHEIKTPINSIGGLAELLDDGTLAPAQRRHVEGIRSSYNMLHELTENILGLSRAEANALSRVDQDFDLCALVEPLLAMFAAPAARRGVAVERDIAPDVPCFVHGDGQKLRHLLMNLLSNALKFTPRGAVCLRITQAAGSAPHALRLRFEVADTGVGLPDGDIGWLFEPFTQFVHPDLGASVRGTGLGLAICQRMVAFLGGTIGARPNPGGGSVFSFELPFAPARRSNGSAEMKTGLTVLVVEDDPASAIVAEGYLRDIGQIPLLAHNVAEAKRALGAHHVDLLLTDHRLGGATGLDLARDLRHAPNPAWQRLPIILVTAATPSEASIAGGAANIDLIIEKPFSRSALKHAIRQVFGTVAQRESPVAAPAPAKPEPDPIIDRHTLNQMLTDLGYERAGRVVQSFLDTAPRLRWSMAAGLRSGDFAKTAEAAHQLISAASFVGLPGVARAARDLHTACAAREAQRARDIHRRLDALCAASLAELQQFWSRVREDFHTDYS